MATRVRMRRVFFLLLFFSVAQISLAQTPQKPPSSPFKVGLRFEYFSRTIGWDEDQTSPMTALLPSLALAYEISPGFSLTGLVGYSVSTFDGLVFRELPFSIDFEGGYLGGFLLGAELDWKFLSGGALEFGVFGQFLADLGVKKTWDIPGLAVSGTLEGKATWMRAALGPLITYTGWESFSAYIFPSFNYLWGTFSMEETVESLSKKENKEIKGKSQFGIALGTIFELSERIHLKGEAGLYPYKNGFDYSATLQALISF